MSEFEYSENTKKLIGSNPFNLREDLEATITSYQSPITMIAQAIETKIENDCVKAVQRYGFDIDVEELYKALNYDREQYQKGYAAAKRDYARPQGEWIPIDGFVVKCSVCGVESFDTPFCPRCGADMRGEDNDRTT